MDTCDVLIAGGGPAGSSCAWALHRAGRDVIVMDRAVFPRDKVCAGWVTPQVFDDLEVDLPEYRLGRTLQPITGFRVGLIDDDRVVTVDYRRPVSHAVRRCEFDDFLLRRSGARVRTGEAVGDVHRDGAHWVVNGAVRAAMLVGAGGHFCPVARLLNPGGAKPALIAAQEVELELDGRAAAAFAVEPGIPEMYFSPDLRGYGWCLRKENFVNIGLGRLDGQALPTAASAFVSFLKARRRIPSEASWTWRGHAYLAGPPSRRTTGDGVLLAGDAAGLASPASGEGIRAAVESGLLAAGAIVAAGGRYGALQFAAYERALRLRFGPGTLERRVSHALPAGAAARLAAHVLDWPWFVRHVVLERWFLHSHQPALAAV